MLVYVGPYSRSVEDDRSTEMSAIYMGRVDNEMGKWIGPGDKRPWIDSAIPLLPKIANFILCDKPAAILI